MSCYWDWDQGCIYYSYKEKFDETSLQESTTGSHLGDRPQMSDTGTGMDPDEDGEEEVLLVLGFYLEMGYWNIWGWERHWGLSLDKVV